MKRLSERRICTEEEIQTYIVSLKEWICNGVWLPSMKVQRQSLPLYLANKARPVLSERLPCHPGTIKTGRHHAGLFILYGALKKRPLGLILLQDHESPATIFNVIMTYWKNPPKVFIYDNGCNLQLYCRKREPHFFADTLIVCDTFHHEKGHVCGPAFSFKMYARSTPLLRRINVSLQEQFNSYLEVGKYITKMNQIPFSLHLLHLVATIMEARQSGLSYIVIIVSPSPLIPNTYSYSRLVYI
jgi:hypothetical protein